MTVLTQRCKDEMTHADRKTTTECPFTGCYRIITKINPNSTLACIVCNGVLSFTNDRKKRGKVNTMSK